MTARRDPRATVLRTVGLATRLAWAPLAALLAGALTWCAVTLLPGDPASRILGPHATPERVAELRRMLGLDRPPLERFGAWLGGLLRGDLGTSDLTGEPVTALVVGRLGNSLLLAGLAAALALTVGIAVGTIIGVRRRYRGVANAVLVGVSAVPDFVVGTVAVASLALTWRVLPALSMVPPGAGVTARPELLVIPALAMALPVATWTARYTAAAVAAQAGAPHLRAARQLGVPGYRVVLCHLLPGALAPLVQLFGWITAALVGSTVVVEQLVAYPGAGSLLVEAVSNRDLTLTTAIVTALAAIVAAAVVASDLAAARLDPRLGAA